MRSSTIFFTVVLLASSFSLAILQSSDAQEDLVWARMDPVSGPSPRTAHSIAYDAESDRVVLFGGATITAFSRETWAYDFNTNTWTNMMPDLAPGARVLHDMAYDEESDRILLFGGQDASSGRGDTWAYDLNLNTWINMMPDPRPPSRWDHRMAYDSESDRVILHAGHLGPTVHRDTWAYDFNTNGWQETTPSTIPTARGPLAYDRESDSTVGFGGLMPPDLTRTDETWTYDHNANKWTKRGPASSPTPRFEHAVVYNVELDRIILFGGGDMLTSPEDDTWAYDTNTDSWAELDVGTRPSGRFGHRMAYDSESKRTILFGGTFRWLEPTLSNGETWALGVPMRPPAFDSLLFAAVLAGVGVLVVGVAIIVWRRRKGGGEVGK